LENGSQTSKLQPEASEPWIFDIALQHNAPFPTPRQANIVRRTIVFHTIIFNVLFK